MSDILLLDSPAEGISRITLNRPDKRNALNYAMRQGIIEQLQANDQDPEVRVTIIRGAGKCFSAGYDIGDGDQGEAVPYSTSGADGGFMRHVTESWMSIWDLAKPVIAQVHGYCLAGGSELAAGCDLIYVAEDAQIGYPAVRFGVPDMQYHAHVIGMRAAMEMMLTGDSFSGIEAVDLAWANRAYPLTDLDEAVLEIASRIALVPLDIGQLNKRTVHRAMEAAGLRAAIRSGTELSALGTQQESFKRFIAESQGRLTKKLQERDSPFGDYRTEDGD